AHDLEPRIVPPLVGVPDAHLQHRQLRLRLFLRLRRHPIERVDPAAERGDQVADHLLDARLVGSGEVALDVELAHRLSHRRVGHAHRPLPTVAQLERTGQDLAAESKFASTNARGRKPATCMTAWNVRYSFQVDSGESRTIA